MTEQGAINDLRIQVNITHTYIGDLRVDLIAPDGTAVMLHNNTGGSANDLSRPTRSRAAGPPPAAGQADPGDVAASCAGYVPPRHRTPEQLAYRGPGRCNDPWSRGCHTWQRGGTS